MIIGVGLIITRLVITIHLGMNPRRGGSPPIDKKLIMIRKLIFDGSWIDRDSFEDVILFILIRGMMVSEEVVEYMVKYIVVIRVDWLVLINNHAMWEIDE